MNKQKNKDKDKHMSETDKRISSLSTPGKKSLSDWARGWMEVIFAPLAVALDRLNISPNAVTVLAGLLGLSAGVTLATGHWVAAVGLIATSGFLDAIDGLLARQMGKSTPFGAFLDSVLDRWSDSAFFLGLLVWYTRAGEQLPIILCGVALASSALVSYTRARAEGIGATCKEGWFTRLERVIAIVVGLVLDLMPWALGVIAALSTFTAIQRIYYTARYVRIRPER